MRLVTMTEAAPNSRSHKAFVAVAALALLIAAVLLSYGRNREVTVPLSVRFTGISDKLLLVGTDPVLEVCVKGPSGLLKGLEDSQLTHEIDLASAKPGRLFIKISPETIKVPQGISVLDVHPTSFTIDIDRLMEKLVPVVPDLNNHPTPGHVVSTVVASPSSIKLTGPASMLEKISAVRTTPIDLAGLTEPTKKSVALNLNHSPYVQPVEDILVEVEIMVKERIIEKWVETQVQAAGNDHRYHIRPERIELLLRGPENTMKDLVQGSGIQARVDLKGLKPGTYVRHAVIELPLSTKLVEAKPEVFTVEVLD